MSRYIVSYDIHCNKTRRQIVKIVSGYLYRVQYSIFEGVLSPRGFSDILKKLESQSLEGSDSIRIYKLCEKCIVKAKHMGESKVIEDMKFLIL